MLSRESWFPQAEGLDVGQKRRVKHDCGTDRIMLVSRDDSGYRAFCFRCNDTGFAPPPQEPLADKLARMKRQREADATTMRPELPTPAVYDLDLWPTKARLWLYKVGIHRGRVGELGAYYHPTTDRVILPIYSAGVPVFWQGRAVDGRQPKYLAPSADRTRVIPRYGSSPTVTLTEDILSAFKVGLAGEGWSLMGTRASDHLVAELLRRKCPVNVWLDGDAAGLKGARSVAARLKSVGIQVRIIHTERDPKTYTKEEIHDTLRKEVVVAQSEKGCA